MKLKDIVDCIETFAPLALQESYDNSGLIVGDMNKDVNNALLCVDITEAILQEAIDKNCDLIISHHPLIFGNGIMKLQYENPRERIIVDAIKNDIAIYAAHTNIDNLKNGLNAILCQKLNIINTQVITPKKDILRKLVTFCPADKADLVRNALFNAGAGNIGNYLSCSFNSDGTGTFLAKQDTNPYVGEKGKLHFEKEIKIETIYPVFLEKQIISSMIKAHPYEEVAYDVFLLENDYPLAGAGLVGNLFKPMTEIEFLGYLKKTINASCLRHTSLLNKNIAKIAVSTGSGSFLISQAILSGADAFITADLKYHQFFEAQNKILIIDIGHYESEYLVKDLLYNVLKEKFSNFAIEFSKINENPVFYF